VAEARARALQAGFLLRLSDGRPFVTLKLATSFDGRIATASGESQWITGAGARSHVHALRLSHDAILVGGGTARADLPSLNVRGLGPVRQPVRVIATTRPLPDLPPEGPDHGPLWQVGGDPRAILADLAARGITRLFCEGGGILSAALVQAGVVDQLIGYTAGIALGAEGRASIAPLALPNLAAAPRFRLVESRAIGPDLFHRWLRA